MSSNKARRKICVVVNSRANYGRIKSVMRAIQDHPDLELQTIVGASALLYRFGHAVDNIRADGFEPSATVYSIVEGENPTTMAKSTGMAIMDLSTQFENLRPDVVLTVADRFETIATAIAASYMNIPVAHTQGGEVTGSIDESVRHAVSKLAHVHFPATELAKDYLLRMGEEEVRVHMTGCPAIDLIADLDLALPPDLFTSNKGVGATLDPSQPYLVVLQHPVTTEFGQGFEQVQETLAAVLALDMQTAWLWPNVDAGSDDVSKGLRMHREINGDGKLHFYRNFTPEDYARLIANAACLIGNSSSGLREGAFLGTPTVDVGTRQARREHGENVVHAGYDRAEVETKARQQIAHGRYSKSALFGDGSAGRQIADVLAGAPVSVQKRLSYG
ncbi:MAG: UDP-N-acetylglucosamine 2-epimerase [Alphaproteobacteria bacterium]|jgi:UDP-hydrolysing UDP-N-acetyl-D-glucosamine 2-epimerase|nr:UDP-N-acetylglucosamine 2-epimerase [Alphaproteobacteria bacterium]MDP6256275.1 UDP-N-acetylglucosamine 2-epimerase [Alphaproteobacteria bacterium]MDP7054968.1 UDP-N-acetylglucosamine 2-epimerase [Alphaproteobacteria bacterium]MDP7227753.1 UDP-N-acetylglucosamine 2-epimerase [Alphaproteobacteria bacterium]MDP7462009.1 UDP-N-acetylglucosamine 2-epimerase [Alphaproteobacteria bacterium]|tara:strand:- start:972 stop:2138 length:1167 start_codon:yes stop_codon:yes gene_type:complete